MSPEERENIKRFLASEDCPPHMMPVYRWWLQRRAAQTPPYPLPYIWFLLGGRGSGKTWTAANHIYEYCVTLPFDRPDNRIIRVGLVGAVFDDVKQTMVEGQSGLLNVVPEENIIAWNRTLGELKFFIRDGAFYREVHCNTYTSEKPNKLRGPNTHIVWVDEVAKFKDANIDPTKEGTTWNNLVLGLRSGSHPHVIVTGTPKNNRLVRYINSHPEAYVSRMFTTENADNLAKTFMDEIMRYGNSRTARQEIYAEILTDNPNSIFDPEMIRDNRLDPDPEQPLVKVLGYDPSASSAEDADECGVILTGYTPEVRKKSGPQGGHPAIISPIHAYVLDDFSGHYTPSEQVKLIMQIIFAQRVDDLVFEQNQGVEFVMTALEQALKDYTNGQYKIRKSNRMRRTEYGSLKRFYVSAVLDDGSTHKFTINAIHATKNKQVRAESASARYDTGYVHHPTNPEKLKTCQIEICRTSLEEQMSTWGPGDGASPDRLDALVYTMLIVFGNNNMHRGTVTVSPPPDRITQETSQHQAIKKKRFASLYSTDLVESGVNYGRPTEPSALDRSLAGDIPIDEILSDRYANI